MTDREAARAATLARIAARIPELRVGDEWLNAIHGKGEISTITKLEPHDGFPWPMVTASCPRRPGDCMGAPGFIGATLISRGTGEAWVYACDTPDEAVSYAARRVHCGMCGGAGHTRRTCEVQP